MFCGKGQNPGKPRSIVYAKTNPLKVYIDFILAVDAELVPEKGRKKFCNLIINFLRITKICVTCECR